MSEISIDKAEVYLKALICCEKCLKIDPNFKGAKILRDKIKKLN